MPESVNSHVEPIDIEPTYMQPVGGGGGGSGPNEGDIIVTGHVWQSPALYQWVVWGWMEQIYNAGFTARPGYYYTEYQSVLVTPPPADEDKHEVTSTITRQLTAAEQATYDKFLGEVAAADKLISTIPDNAIVRLPTGPDITGAKLKEIWAKTDFVINDINHSYGNGTSRGEAAYRNGDPQVSFNIDLIGGYVNDVTAEGRGGLWVIFHEIGHMTPHGLFLNEYQKATGNSQDAEYSERHADDFARAITEHYTGTSPSLSHIAGAYSADQGSVIFQANEPGPSASNIPNWKFDSVDGVGMMVVV